jgi:hypothetical protein
MGTKTTVAISVASGVLCALVVTQGILPRLEDRAAERTPPVAQIEPAPMEAASANAPRTSGDSAQPVATAEASPARQSSEARAPAGVALDDLRKLLLSSERLEQVRAIQLLLADGSPEACRVLLEAFENTNDPILAALLEEALLTPTLDVAQDVMKAYLASSDPKRLDRLSRLLAKLANSRPELREQVIRNFLAALNGAEASPERAGAAAAALAALGPAAMEELGRYLIAEDSDPAGVGSAAWLIAQSPDGNILRETLSEGLRGSIETLGDANLSPEARDDVLKKTGSLAWSASLRPPEEHDRLGEVLLENLLATRDPAQAGSLAWGLGNLKGLTESSRVETARSLLGALSGPADDALHQQYLRTVMQLATDQPEGPGRDELLRLIEDTQSLQPKDSALGPKLDALLKQLQKAK